MAKATPNVIITIIIITKVTTTTTTLILSKAQTITKFKEWNQEVAGAKIKKKTFPWKIDWSEKSQVEQNV